jgi:hypothetical protein
MQNGLRWFQRVVDVNDLVIAVIANQARHRRDFRMYPVG